MAHVLTININGTDREVLIDNNRSMSGAEAMALEELFGGTITDWSRAIRSGSATAAVVGATVIARRSVPEIRLEDIAGADINQIFDSFVNEPKQDVGSEGPAEDVIEDPTPAA